MRGECPQPTGIELSGRCYLVIAVVAPARSSVALMPTVGGCVGTGVVDSTGHQSGTGFAHRQALLGVLVNGHVLRGLGC